MNDAKEAPAKAAGDVDGDARDPGYGGRGPGYSGRPPKHGAGPREMGREGGEGAGAAMERQATVAQVHGDYALDPTTRIWDIAKMAGYSAEGSHDAMMGIDKLVRGEVHAPGELEVGSFTRGGPMDLEEHESLYSDDAGFGDLNTELGEGERLEDEDWCRELRRGDDCCL